MKKISFVFFILIVCLMGGMSASARVNDFNVFGYDLSGKKENFTQIIVQNFYRQEAEGELDFTEITDKEIVVPDFVLENAKEDEHFILMDMKMDNEKNPYPEIERIEIRVKSKNLYIGKDYRLIFMGNDHAVDVSDKIERIGLGSVSFSVEKLGRYILYYNPEVYSTLFYYEEPQYDEEGETINPGSLYFEIKDAKEDDYIDFPEIPQKDGYVFVGWKCIRRTWGSAGGVGGYRCAGPQPVKVSSVAHFAPMWCHEDEYEPLKINISAEDKIMKGEEDGSVITLTLSEGKFYEEIYEEYIPSENEEENEESFRDWKNYWNVVGSDEVYVKKAELVDEKTVKITLGGNSTDIYINSDIKIEFDNEFYNPYFFYENEHRSEPIYDVQLDEDGVMKDMFVSDNSVRISKQKKTDSSDSSKRTKLVKKYTVTFASNDGSEAKSQSVTRNKTVEMPEIPQKEGYTFEGWFTEPEFSNRFDINQKITSDITLYAKWKENDNRIIFNIGEKKVSVFGNVIENDVAPTMKDGFVFLPIRFIAENLGANVLWNEAERKVNILQNDNEAYFVIDSEKVILNGEEIEMTQPAFIGDERTYIGNL